MAYEVVVVGGGIGGLTAAALLAARGMSVCLVEREARTGGCAATLEHAGYRFEPGAGLYSSWQTGDIHERVFAELPVDAPEVRRIAPPYVVRLPDATDVRVGLEGDAHFAELRAAFPECADAACRFYRELLPVADALQRAAQRFPSLATLSRLGRLKLIASEPRLAPVVLARATHTAAQHLGDTSRRFRRFIDAQLQIFAQVPSGQCSYLYAAVALSQPLRGMYAMRGGGASLASTLAESIKKSGGVVRTGATALRLSFDAAGRADGVELLSGERVEASRAVLSNLTAWDTYGKLVGHTRTPADMRARLKSLRGWGAYLLLLGLEEEGAQRLPAANVLALTDWNEGAEFDAEESLFTFSTAPDWDARAPEGQRAATVSTFTEAARWFTFHEDEAEHEAQDQAALETLWARVHASMPELGASVEVIETETPRTFYERTRRRLGHVGGMWQTPDALTPSALTHRTPIPHLFMVGDTVFPGNGVAAVTHAALAVADEIAQR
ncbi:MAG TPA: FAD-dependent oxidoreductase [Pyrinomonadaceae bacterium]|nr:FAD-dependent oxidoreductase [Pyrinomonadaceae bacterium]